MKKDESYKIKKMKEKNLLRMEKRKKRNMRNNLLTNKKKVKVQAMGKDVVVDVVVNVANASIA